MMSDRRIFRLRACWALLALLLSFTCGDDFGSVMGGTVHQMFTHTGRRVPVLARDSLDETMPFSYLVQLSEAVLAPVWSAGGFAYVVRSEKGSNASWTSGPVCVHTRVSKAGITVPFTFSMFDTQFSTLFLVSPSDAGSGSGVASLAARAVGELDLESGCYVVIRNERHPAVCTGILRSSHVECMFGEFDALHVRWTADSLAAATSAIRRDESLTLDARGLSAAELFTVFVSDYLPQRAWLRTAVPRAVDALSHAQQVADSYHAAPQILPAKAEAEEMQQAVAEQWSNYLWFTYMPLLQRKWILLHRFALATLTPSHMAPSLSESTEESITGGPTPLPKTRCPMVDALPQFRFSIANGRTRDARILARLTVYMEKSLDKLQELLTGGGGSAGGPSYEQVDGPATQLLQCTYCATTTYLISVIALLDAPFLRASSSVWVEPATHKHSWAMRTMRESSVTAAIANATAFQEATAARLARVSSSLKGSEKTFLMCLTDFLDASRPLASLTITSPSDCIESLLRARADAAGGPIRDTLGDVWDVSLMRAVSADSETVPGITRYESAMVLSSTADGATASTRNDSVLWTMLQGASERLTSQQSFYTPAVVSFMPKELCAPDPSSRTSSVAMSKDMTFNKDQHRTHVKARKTGTCAAGTYARTDTATCEVCPSVCSASLPTPTPFFCPGDGLMHGCPTVPAGAIFAGSPSPGLNNSRDACRYVCLNIYQAPLRNGCVSTPGFFYNSTSVMSDGRIWGWLDPCVGPEGLLPHRFPARLYDARVFAFVGSGTTDEPMSCRFALLHRAVSSAVPETTLRRTGLLLPCTSFSPVATATPSSHDVLPSRRGFAWEVAMQLNASLLWEMHTSLLRSQQSATRRGASVATTSIGHELVALREGDKGVASRSRWSWFLMSSYEHPEGRGAAANTLRTGAAPPSSVCYTLRLLLNVSVTATPRSSTAAADVGSYNGRYSSFTPAPSSLTVLSAPWEWAVTSLTTDFLDKSTYRVVLSRMTNTVAFYVDGMMIGNPTTLDWPLLTQSQVAYQPSVNTTMYLSVAGWVAGYREQEQWILTSPSLPLVSNPRALRLPLHYDYVPGMVLRLSSTTAPISPLHEALSTAEATWHSSVAASFDDQLDMTLFREVPFFSRYVAVSPALTAAVSSRLSGLSERLSIGLDGVCRSGFGCIGNTDGACGEKWCMPCPVGSYTVLSATSERNACSCVPQRFLGSVKPSPLRDNECLPRPRSPAAPESHMRRSGILCIDAAETSFGKNISAHDGIPLGSYTRGFDASDVGRVYGNSLEGLYSCTYSLSVVLLESSIFAPWNGVSANLRYTTGLGDEECSVRAVARAGFTSLLTEPNYSVTSTYRPRICPPPLPARAITLRNNSRLVRDQTVLVVNVRDYALLPRFSVSSLLHMSAFTEYQAAFLVYMLRCATVSAVLRCGSPLRDIGSLTWAGSSSLDSSLLRIHLTGVITEKCQLSFTVHSASAAASDTAVPHTSWPYNHLTTEADTSLFFEESPTVQYTLLPSAEASERARGQRDPLSETSTLVISLILSLLSLLLVGILWANQRPPSLHPLSWRAYERAHGQPVPQR